MRARSAPLFTDIFYDNSLLHLFILSVTNIFLKLHLYILEMAPGLTDVLPQQIPIGKIAVPISIFPDGIKTSGQHPPLYEEIRSYDDFPGEISGPTVWNADDYKNKPERWTHQLAEEEIAELSEAADNFKAAAIPLTGISKVE